MMVLPCVSSESSCPAHRVCKRPSTQQTSPGRPLTGRRARRRRDPAAGPVAGGPSRQSPGSSSRHVRSPLPGSVGGPGTGDGYPAPAGRPGTGDGVANVVITGGAGFVGSRLARELLTAGSLGVAGGAAGQLSRVTLIDRSPAPADLAADGRVAAIRGDLGELLDPAPAGWQALA